MLFENLTRPTNYYFDLIVLIPLAENSSDVGNASEFRTCLVDFLGRMPTLVALAPKLFECFDDDC